MFRVIRERMKKKKGKEKSKDSPRLVFGWSARKVLLLLLRPLGGEKKNSFAFSPTRLSIPRSRVGLSIATRSRSLQFCFCCVCWGVYSDTELRNHVVNN